MPRKAKTSKIKTQKRNVPLNPFKRQIFLGVAALILIVVLFFIGSFAWFALSSLQPSLSSLHYIYQPGTRTENLVKELSQLGLVQQPRYFAFLARIYGIFRPLQAGEYQFTGQESPLQILYQMATGDVVKHKLTIVEGWTFNTMMKGLNQAPMLNHKFLGLTEPQILQRLHIPYSVAEGLFYPSTYVYTYGMSDAQILRHANGLMQKKLAAMWLARSPNLPYQSPYQALIVASLIEKETALDSEKNLISGVILKRLGINMPLQVDPTVIYGLGLFYRAPLTHQQLQIDTPYNTYLHRGLPPTPICMPSATSLLAALHPQMTDALYYVATGQGGHYFSATYQQHKAEIQRAFPHQDKP